MGLTQDRLGYIIGNYDMISITTIHDVDNHTWRCGLIEWRGSGWGTLGFNLGYGGEKKLSS